MRRARLLVLFGLVMVALLGRGFLISRGLSNLAMVHLNRYLSTWPEVSPSTRLDGMQRLFSEALRWDAGNAAAHRGIAWTLMLQGSHAAAAAHWQAGGISQQDLYGLAAQALRFGKQELAEHWISQAQCYVSGACTGGGQRQPVPSGVAD